jgi:predicted GNAT superfamily acetyltransferase
VPKARLRDCEELVKEVFGFRDIDVVPGWAMHSVVRYGGVALGAFDEERVVGFSYGFPAMGPEGPFLYSDGLIVHPGYQSCGVGLALKQAQRREALARGFRTIRMPVDPLSSRPLYLFLTRLGASIVEYLPDHYDPFHQQPFRAGGHDDVVELHWRLEEHGPSAEAPSASPAGDVHRVTFPILQRIAEAGEDRLDSIRSDQQEQRSVAVEIPWSLARLRSDPQAATSWRLGVRHALTALLATGYLGTRVTLDRGQERAFVIFERGLGDIRAG